MIRIIKSLIIIGLLFGSQLQAQEAHIILIEATGGKVACDGNKKTCFQARKDLFDKAKQSIEKNVSHILGDKLLGSFFIGFDSTRNNANRLLDDLSSCGNNTSSLYVRKDDGMLTVESHNAGFLLSSKSQLHKLAKNISMQLFHHCFEGELNEVFSKLNVYTITDSFINDIEKDKNFRRYFDPPPTLINTSPPWVFLGKQDYVEDDTDFGGQYQMLVSKWTWQKNINFIGSINITPNHEHLQFEVAMPGQYKLVVNRQNICSSDVQNGHWSCSLRGEVFDIHFPQDGGYSLEVLGNNVYLETINIQVEGSKKFFVNPDSQLINLQSNISSELFKIGTIPLCKNPGALNCLINPSIFKVNEKKQQLITLNKRVYGRLMITQSSIDETVDVQWQEGNIVISGSGTFFKKTQLSIGDEENCVIEGNSWSCYLTKWHFWPIGRDFNITMNDTPFPSTKKSQTLSWNNYAWLNIIFILICLSILAMAIFLLNKLLYEKKKHRDYMLLAPIISDVKKKV